MCRREWRKPDLYLVLRLNIYIGSRCKRLDMVVLFSRFYPVEELPEE